MERLITLALIIFSQHGVAKKCKVESDLSANDIGGKEYYCPSQQYPETYTECCGEGACCLAFDSKIMDDWLLRVISLTVIAVCFCLVVALLVCCFWARCPLYTACRSNYNSADVAMYSYTHGEDPMCLMPKESNNTRYAPLKVSTRKLDDDS